MSMSSSNNICENKDHTERVNDNFLQAQTLNDFSSSWKGKRVDSMPSLEGGFGKVKFYVDGNDKIYAIKTPLEFKFLIEKYCFPQFNSEFQIKITNDLYLNVLKISEKTNNHPNFMHVHDVVFKDKIVFTYDNSFNKLYSNVEKPYQVLEYIEGEMLSDRKGLSLEDYIVLLNQQKDALLYLFDSNIAPQDVNWNNIMVTLDLKIKMIDFDGWKYSERVNPQNYFDIMRCIASDVKNQLDLQLDFQDIKPLNNSSHRQWLEDSCNQIINKFQERVK